MRFFIYLLLLAVGFLVYVRLLERRTVFCPHTDEITVSPADIRLAYEEVEVKTPDGFLLNGWFVPAAHPSDRTVTFLFFHGNAGHIGDCLDKIELLHELGGNTLIIDYRGYGKSEGRPSEEGFYIDARASYDYLAGRKDVNRERIVIYGASLGGAAATELAPQRPVGGLVLHATFTSARDVGKMLYPFIPGFLIQTKMDSLAKVGRIKVPKLFIHSPQDEVIPYEMGKKLFDAAAEPKEFLSIDGTHNEAHVTSQEAYMAGMRAFLKKYFGY